MTIQETPVRLPTYIREDAFFNNPANQVVLTDNLEKGSLRIPAEVFNTDRLYWTSLLVMVVTVFFALTQPEIWMVSLGLGVGVILIITFLNQHLLSQQVMQRFREEGYILRGEVVSCVASTDTFILSHSSGTFYVKVEYQFVTPKGIKIESSLQQPRDDLSGKPLPLPETPLYILYFTDREYYLL